jgi:acylphosphatase
MTRYTMHFSGHVQGVGFRYTTRRIAERFAVSGYVKNLPDGRVELVAEGQKAQLDAFLQELRESMAPVIHDSTIDEGPANGEFGTPGQDPLTIAY